MLCLTFFSGCNTMMYNLGINRQAIVTVAERLKRKLFQYFCTHFQTGQKIPDGHRHRSDAQCHMLRRCEVNRYKSQPNDACGVHRKANKLGLIKCLGDFARQNGINSANNNQQNRIRESYHIAGVDGGLEKRN